MTTMFDFMGECTRKISNRSLYRLPKHSQALKAIIAQAKTARTDMMNNNKTLAQKRESLEREQAANAKKMQSELRSLEREVESLNARFSSMRNKRSEEIAHEQRKYQQCLRRLNAFSTECKTHGNNGGIRALGTVADDLSSGLGKHASELNILHSKAKQHEIREHDKQLRN